MNCPGLQAGDEINKKQQPGFSPFLCTLNLFIIFRLFSPPKKVQLINKVQECPEAAHKPFSGYATTAMKMHIVHRPGSPKK